MAALTERYGAWAVVTGATSGIGKEFAHQLATEGLNVVLVARTEETLRMVALELEDTHRVETRTVAVDLGSADASTAIVEATNDLEVGVLVNNAAAMLAGSFSKTQLADEKHVLKVNLEATVELSWLFAGAMCRRGRGAMIFVAGMGGFSSMPFMANYMATKAYLISFGEALHDEFKEQGVDVTVVCPGVTNTGAQLRTKGLDGRKMERLVRRGTSVEPVVSSAMAALGRKSVAVPGALNRLIVGVLFRVLPRSVVRGLLARTVRGAVFPELT